MKRSLVLVLLGGLFAIGSCKADDPPSSSASTDADAQSSTGTGGADDSKNKGVPCTHPGAGKSIGADRCDCSTTRSVAGEWTATRTCREGDLCPTKNKEEPIVFTQDGTTVRAERGDGYSLTGTLCGDVLVWSGGPKDGLNPECGLIRFSDDSHYMSDSCYVASGECARAFDQGCPSSKGQCTGTGAKAPDPATPIQKVICTQ